MSDHQLYLSQVAEVIRELFDEYDGPITLETTARDVPQWDSLSNVRLMVLIEQELAVRFSTAEVQGFKNLGSLIDAVVKRKQNQ
jgi:acyl carrier protein